MNWKTESDRLAIARVRAFGSLESALQVESAPRRAVGRDAGSFPGRRELDVLLEERALQRSLGDVWG